MLTDFANLPESWTVRPLSDCAERPDYGFTASAAAEKVGPKFLRITDIQDGQVDWDSVPYCSLPEAVNEEKTLHRGDIVVARIGATTGKAFLIGECPRAIFASYLIRLRTKPEMLSPDFLYYFLHTDFYWTHIDKHKDDRLKGGVNIPALTSISIPVPTRSEQSLIARVLGFVQRAISIEERAEKVTMEMKGGVLHEILTRGLRGECQKDTEIGLIPESWDVVPLGSLGRVGNGSTPKKTIPGYWTGGTYPWLTSAKVYDREIVEANQFVTDVALRECHLPRVEPGAILIAITGQGKTLGHCAVLRMQATINQHIAYVATDTNRAIPSFVRGYLETQYEYLRQVGSGGGSTKGALTCAFLRSLPIPLPPTLGEQREIVEIFDAIDRKIDLHQRKRAVLEDLFKALLHKLMTGEIRVADLDLSALTKWPLEGVAA